MVRWGTPPESIEVVWPDGTKTVQPFPKAGSLRILLQPMPPCGFRRDERVAPDG